MSLYSSEPLNQQRPTLAGDWQDDDGQVIDDLVQPQANPLPVPVQEMTDPITERPKRAGRLLTGSMSPLVTWGAVQILPADPNRKSVTVQNNSATVTDTIRVADDPAKLQGAGPAGEIFPANPLRLEGYTGPLYIAVGTVAGTSVPVSWWAVTE